MFARTLEGGQANPESRFPGYLNFYATTGRDVDQYGAVQYVGYYISDNAESSTMEHGPLVRWIFCDLLAVLSTTGSQAEGPPGEELLPNVKEMEVTFLDGEHWQERWQHSGTDPLPQAVRVRIVQSGSDAMPLEIFVPITIEPQTP